MFGRILIYGTLLMGLTLSWPAPAQPKHVMMKVVQTGVVGKDKVNWAVLQPVLPVKFEGQYTGILKPGEILDCKPIILNDLELKDGGKVSEMVLDCNEKSVHLQAVDFDQ